MVVMLAGSFQSEMETLIRDSNLNDKKRRNTLSYSMKTHQVCLTLKTQVVLKITLKKIPKKTLMIDTEGRST